MKRRVQHSFNAFLFFLQFGFIDATAAVIVAVLLLRAAWNIARPALAELTDAGADRKALEEMAQHMEEMQRAMQEMRRELERLRSADN